MPERPGKPMRQHGYRMLRDLAPQVRLLAGCSSCKHVGAIDRQAITRRFGEHAFLEDIQRRLKCTNCGWHMCFLMTDEADPPKPAPGRFGL